MMVEYWGVLLVSASLRPPQTQACTCHHTSLFLISSFHLILETLTTILRISIYLHAQSRPLWKISRSHRSYQLVLYGWSQHSNESKTSQIRSFPRCWDRNKVSLLRRLLDLPLWIPCNQKSPTEIRTEKSQYTYVQRKKQWRKKRKKEVVTKPHQMSGGTIIPQRNIVLTPLVLDVSIVTFMLESEQIIEDDARFVVW